MQIFKYETMVRGRLAIAMPRGARVLAVQDQRGAVTMWAEVDAEAPLVERHFVIVGTGHNFDHAGLNYLGTVQSGILVWHVYEQTTA